MDNGLVMVFVSSFNKSTLSIFVDYQLGNVLISRTTFSTFLYLVSPLLVPWYVALDRWTIAGFPFSDGFSVHFCLCVPTSHEIARSSSRANRRVQTNACVAFC